MIINTFFLRVAARCNLDCDYCYVFKHRDDSWKDFPPVMSLDTVIKFSERLKEYSEACNLNEINVIFHGGEPLTCGENNLIQFVDTIRSKLGSSVIVSFSLQTNGTLLTESFVEKCVEKNIGISVSIDGDKDIHDKHRKQKNGDGSFDSVYKNIGLLKEYSSIFEGTIGVIDPSNSPDSVLSFFYNNKLYDLDLLLPDSTYEDLPYGREYNPDLYKNYLIDTFDLWVTKYPQLKIRTFEYILEGLIGNNTSLDAFGLGKLDYLTIETDGSYHTSDILKVAYKNASALGISIFDHSIEDALNHKKVHEYNKLLSEDHLPKKCKTCQYSRLCGGGSLAHRYSSEKGFDNPTVYCAEMFSLITHANDFLTQEINKDK